MEPCSLPSDFGAAAPGVGTELVRAAGASILRVYIQALRLQPNVLASSRDTLQGLQALLRCSRDLTSDGYSGKALAASGGLQLSAIGPYIATQYFALLWSSSSQPVALGNTVEGQSSGAPSRQWAWPHSWLLRNRLVQ